MARKKRDPKAVELANRIISEYAPETVEDMEDALKDIFGPMFEAMLQGEMNNHLGYSSNDKSDKPTENRRNGYGNKTLKTSKGEVEINVPRDRDASFDPKLIKKRQRDVSEIEDKVISMYAKGMSQRDISSTIEDIYGFSVSHEMISDITDAVIPEMEEWQSRPLEKCYTFVFVDCLYTKIRNDYEIKARGVEDIFFLSMDGVSGLEAGVKAIFPQTIVQRCIVHLVRNSVKYVPSKDYKAFTASLKKVYGATSLKACHTAFEAFKQQWSQYPGAIDVWIRNFAHVEQLFDYGSNIRKIMYTTNAVESIHSSYRKVTKKGAFPNENALLKLLFIRTKELEKKWSTGFIPNWSMVMNQLLLHDQIKERVIKYLE